MSADADPLVASARQQLRAGRLNEAIQGFRRAAQQAPDSVAAWTGLGHALHRAGRHADGAAAHGRALQAAQHDPAFAPILQALAAGRAGEAFQALRARLQAEPNEAPSLRLMADLALRAHRPEEGFALLVQLMALGAALEESLDRASRALQAMPPAKAQAAVDALVARNPAHLGFQNFKAMLMERRGDYAGAVALYRGITDKAPGAADAWVSLGDVLEVTGETQQAVSAYRRSLAVRPANGRAWWSLANIKTHRFEPSEVQAMRDLLARSDLPPRERTATAFALGKALEDAGQPEAAFASYAQANALLRERRPYDHARLQDEFERARRLFTPEFFAQRAGQGEPATDPIFIVGLPRSGSTLVEHMLAAHPAIEGTAELVELPRATMRLDAPGGRYPEALAALDAPALAAIGATYLAETRVYRHTGKPRFTDKTPANWRHVGLIRSVLPNARIVDVRRHPLACGFSCLRQYFATGFEFANDLEDIGRYYRLYAEAMAHWETVLPGRVHRVIYEDLVADPEGELRRLLTYLDLPFDEACLRAHESPRAVRTPSASQVRQPLHRQGLEGWRAFEPWLGPLKSALGEVLEHWR